MVGVGVAGLGAVGRQVDAPEGPLAVDLVGQLQRVGRLEGLVEGPEAERRIELAVRVPQDPQDLAIEAHQDVDPVLLDPVAAAHVAAAAALAAEPPRRLVDRHVVDDLRGRRVRQRPRRGHARHAAPQDCPPYRWCQALSPCRLWRSATSPPRGAPRGPRAASRAAPPRREPAAAPPARAGGGHCSASTSLPRMAARRRAREGKRSAKRARARTCPPRVADRARLPHLGAPERHGRLRRAPRYASKHGGSGITPCTRRGSSPRSTPAAASRSPRRA